MFADVAAPFTLTFRLLARFWPQLVALVLAGILAGDLLMLLAARSAFANHMLGLALLTLVALAQLIVTVAMFQLLRPALPAVRAAQAAAGGEPVAGRRRRRLALCLDDHHRAAAVLRLLRRLGLPRRHRAAVFARDARHGAVRRKRQRARRAGFALAAAVGRGVVAGPQAGAKHAEALALFVLADRRCDLRDQLDFRRSLRDQPLEGRLAGLDHEPQFLELSAGDGRWRRILRAGRRHGAGRAGVAHAPGDAERPVLVHDPAGHLAGHDGAGLRL